MTMIDEDWARRWCAAMSSGVTAKALAFYGDDVWDARTVLAQLK